MVTVMCQHLNTKGERDDQQFSKDVPSAYSGTNDYTVTMPASGDWLVCVQDNFGPVSAEVKVTVK